MAIVAVNGGGNTPNGNAADGSSNTLMVGEEFVRSHWVPVVGDWNGDGRDSMADGPGPGAPWIISEGDTAIGAGTHVDGFRFDLQGHHNLDHLSLALHLYDGSIPIGDITDGTSNTLMFDEHVLGTHEVPWQGEDLIGWDFCANDNNPVPIWIDVGAPVMTAPDGRKFDTLRGDDQSLNQAEHATDPINTGSVMGDGSVRFVSDSISPSGEDGQGLFQINLATDQPTGFPSYPGAVFVASGDVNASHHSSSALEGVTDGTSNTLMFHDDLIGWNFTNNTNNPVADGDTGRHSFVFGVELPDAVGLDDGILAAAVGGTAHQGIVIMDNVVEVFYRGDYGGDTAPEADWLLL